MTDFATALAALPEGSFHGTANGRRYIVTKSSYARGKSIKLVADELGGNDYISLNWYVLATVDLLRSCEMPETKVRAFVDALVPDG
ncbi:MAG: hypothetical protein AAFQ58_11655 [Pseudomonadota bacterium]